MKLDLAKLDPDLLRDLVWAEAKRRYLAGETGEAVCRDMGLKTTTFRRRARDEGWRLCDRLTADEARGGKDWRADAMRETPLAEDPQAATGPEPPAPLSAAETQALEAEALAFSRKAAKLVRAGRLEAGETALKEAERRTRIVRRLKAWAETDAATPARIEEMSDADLRAHLERVILGRVKPT